ncbi:MAG TPA: single-stranded DNA-binding protein [Mediterranea massiliensis]|uniref:Single-stranded DNA-binding protein n=1 Tax=Mediterranea massiliensis TaxID=1841865 RepID=A0A921HUL0_9BACT|nr:MULTISPECIES: single-stranded DNA-binding protein [Bacteroidaceae]MBM6945917.1 single-stranded DNA-binding protein [Bacteroides gallinaceum]OUO53673.1 single-stranded DNA-binding protein [Bacteroides sp. An279]HJF90763.1 single-stranded DNA-binding protein [Mediterranea massiliensis]
MKKIENSFVVSGFVANEAQVRNFETASVARFSIAVSRSEKKGEVTTYTSAFLAVEAWRKNEAADSFDRIKKGEHLTVKGYFKPEEWTDSATGQKRNRIVMSAVEFYPTPEKEEEAKPAPSEKKPKRTKKTVS